MPWDTDAAVRLATEAHGRTGATDPGSGEPYITHPLRVMAAVAAAGYDESHQRVAVLHDVVEDTDVDADGLLAKGAPAQEVAAVLAVTKGDPDQDYLARVAKAAADPIGGVVKGFDMLDNSDPDRLAALAAVQPDRAAHLAAKYAAGLARLDTLRPGWRGRQA
jgi:hypothetical protein